MVLLEQAYKSTEQLVALILTVVKRYGADIFFRWMDFLQMDGLELCIQEKGRNSSEQTVWANSAKMPPEAWYEMYWKPWHPELVRVGMCVLSQVISGS